MNDKFELLIFRLSVANKRCFGVCLCIYLIDNYAWYLIHLRFLSNKLNYGNIKINPCAQKRAGSAAFRSFITTCYDRRVADLQLTLDKEVAPSSDLHFHKLFFRHQCYMHHYPMKMRDTYKTCSIKDEHEEKQLTVSPF